MIGQLLLAFISTFAFAILFSAPRSQYFACGLCGCFTWGMYLLFQPCGHIAGSADRLVNIAGRDGVQGHLLAAVDLAHNKDTGHMKNLFHQC